MAGGFFSGGSSDAVNASVAEAEAAAREAEAARDEINNKFVEYAGQTEEGSYTVPNADDALETKFLRQDGTWNIPPAGSDGATTLAELTDTSISSPTDNQYLRYNGTDWINETVDPTELTAGTGLEINSNTISIQDSGVGTDQLAADAVTTVKIVDNGISRAKIADSAINDSKLATAVAGTANQLLSATGAGDFTWVTPAAGTTYTASDGVTLDGDDFQLTDLGVTTAKLAADSVTSAKILNNNVTADELNVTGDGTAGQILSSDGDGSFTWVDENAADAYTAGTGLTLTGQEFSITDGGVDTDQIAADAVDGGKLDATNTPTAGQFLTANLDNSFTWVTPAAGTAYSAGTGLDLSDTDQFSIADGGVDTTQLADNGVNAAKLNVDGNGTDGQYLTSDGDGSFSWTSEGNTLRGLTDTSIPATITDRRLLEYEPNDGTWNATSITDILRISDMFDVHEDTPTDNQFLRYDAGNANGPGWVNETVSIPANLSFTAPLSRSGNTVSITDGGINTTQIADDAIDADKLSVSGTNGQILSTDSSGDLAWIDADGNTAYTAGTGLTLTSDEFSVTPNGITNALLANNSVRTENIADGTITGADMADGTITATQIADDTITNAKLADNTITAAKVAANTLTASQLATDSVTSFKIQDGAVIAGKIANNVVGADELNVDGDGTSGQFLTSDGDGTFSWTTSSGGVTYTAGQGLNLSDTNVFTVPNDGITSSLIATNAVGTDQIADNAVTGTQINAGAVDTTELVDLAVETAKLSDGAVTNAKLGTGAVNTSKIFDGAVTTDKILDSNVTAGKLALNSVTTAKIADDAVNNAKLGTDIPISTLFDVDTTGVNNGQILVFNGTTWMPANNSGGGNTDNSRLAISLTETSLNEGDSARTLTATLSIANAETGETQSGQSVTVTDPLGHSVNVDGSGTTFTFSASGANVGNYVIRASATLTLQGAASGTVHTASVNLPVNATNTDWYQWVTDTQPTAITSTDVVDNGVFSSPETGTWTRPDEDTDSSELAYVALPTRTEGYTFHAGLLFASITEIGVISTDYTLYRLDDFPPVAPGGDRIITITET